MMEEIIRQFQELWTSDEQEREIAMGDQENPLPD